MRGWVGPTDGVSWPFEAVCGQTSVLPTRAAPQATPTAAPAGRRGTPEQPAAELVPVAAVVLPAGHAAHPGDGVVWFPASEYVPMAHAPQDGPLPKPAAHTLAVRLKFGSSGCVRVSG